MSTQTIFWKGYTHEERHLAIAKIQGIIAKYGDIVDSTIFSDFSLTLKIEIAAFKIQPLYTELKMFMGMNPFEWSYTNSIKEIIVFLSTTFSKGTGNLTVSTPAVPG